MGRLTPPPIDKRVKKGKAKEINVRGQPGGGFAGHLKGGEPKRKEMSDPDKGNAK